MPCGRTRVRACGTCGAGVEAQLSHIILKIGTIPGACGAGVEAQPSEQIKKTQNEKNMFFVLGFVLVCRPLPRCLVMLLGLG